MMRPGEDLQRLVSILERVTSGNADIHVTSPDKLLDKDTHKLREHDVVVRLSQGHHTITIALECRDRSRPVGVPEIEAFHAKCQRTSVNQGIIVSSKGFTRTALRKSESFNIRCFLLTSMGEIEWCSAEFLKFHHMQYKTGVLHIDFEDRDLTGKAVYIGDFVELKDEIVNSILHSAFRCFASKVPIETSSGSRRSAFPIRIDLGTPFYVNMDGERIHASQVWGEFEYGVDRRDIKLTLLSYFDETRAAGITEAIVANIPHPSGNVNLVISVNPDGTKSVKFVRDGISPAIGRAAKES